jgi:hypothetical protein
MSCLSIEAFLNDLREHRQDKFQIFVRLREMVLAAGPAITFVAYLSTPLM